VMIGRGGMVTVLWGISLHDTGLMDGLSGRPQARSNGGVRGWGVLGGEAPPRLRLPSTVPREVQEWEDVRTGSFTAVVTSALARQSCLL